MARLDLKTLVTVFEERIEALEKNPPELVKSSAIISMLEQSIDKLIKEHFLSEIKKELKDALKNEFANMKNEFICEVLQDIFDDINFRSSIVLKIQESMMNGLK